jgi:23S rRNA (adenine2503-C2)-methyltransferase
LRRLAEIKPKFNLAISLHSAIDKKRSQIMPVNKTNPLKDLIDVLKFYYKRTQKRITFEYLLIDGLTDTMYDAKSLAAFCKNFPCKINLIEYNPNPFVDFRKSKPENTNRFLNFLKSKNLVVTLRKSKGQDINAACGQLVKKLEISKK